MTPAEYRIRCRMAESCLPEAEYRTRITALHDEMLTEIEKDIALLRQALEAMEESHYAVADTAPHADVMAHYAVIEALRERLGVKE